MNLNFNDNIKDFLVIIREQKHLTDYEYVNLISLLVLKQIITHNTITELDVTTLINIIRNKDNKKFINDNNQVYYQAIKYIVEEYFNNTGVSNTSYSEIMNNWFNGYLFHTLNDSFVNEINENGLVLNNKPWDIEEIKRIKKIFNKAIFGISNAEDNIIFFARSLTSSPYYGLTSPTFFRKFVENDPHNINIFLNRDLYSSNESIIELCRKYNITGEEYDYVLNFFKKYWLVYANNRLPSLLLKKRDKVTIPDMPDGDVCQYVVDKIYADSRNEMFKHDIPRDELIIFSYHDLEIKKKKSLQL